MPHSRVGQSSNHVGLDTPETPTTPTPRATSTPSSAAPSRGPSVTVDSTPRSTAQQRLAQINGRTAGAPPGAPLAARSPDADYAATRHEYTMQILGGAIPQPPPAPPLPHRTGHEVFEAIGGRVPDMSAGYLRALRDCAQNQPQSLIEMALNHTVGRLAERAGLDGENASRGVDLGLHTLLEVGCVTSELAIGESVEVATMLASGGAGAVVAADALGVLGREIYGNLHGERIPSHAIMVGMRQDMPRLVARAREQRELQAANSFDAGVRQAALGRSFDATRSGDRAYVMGFQDGQRYRAEHGAAYEIHEMHARALVQARVDAAAIMPSHAPAPDRIVPLTFGHANTVGANISDLGELIP